MNNDWREYYDPNYVLMHHGIKGQRWGVRRFENANGTLTAAGKARYDGDKVSSKEKNAFSMKAAGHKALAKVYGINEKTYAKSNKTLSSMNKAAKEEQLEKAANAQKMANAKRDEKERANRSYKEVDPNVAKNKETKRVALDYHNMNDLQFMAKYQGSKKTFQKRYEKTKGDTYSLGKKKAALALAITAKMPAKEVYIGHGKKLQVTGAKAVARALISDTVSTAIKTNVGYKKAERKYNDKKSSYKEYSKRYDAWSSDQDKNDKAWKEVQKLYKESKKSPEAKKKYSQAYDKWSDEQDRLDQEWREVKAMRRK